MKLTEALELARFLLKMDKERKQSYQSCFIFHSTHGGYGANRISNLIDMEVSRIVTFIDAK